MNEGRGIVFKPKEDLWPYFGLKAFERRNWRALVQSNNGEIWKHRGLQAYNALWYAGLTAGVLLAISYSMR